MSANPPAIADRQSFGDLLQVLRATVRWSQSDLGQNVATVLARWAKRKRYDGDAEPWTQHKVSRIETGQRENTTPRERLALLAAFPDDKLAIAAAALPAIVADGEAFADAIRRGRVASRQSEILPRKLAETVDVLRSPDSTAYGERIDLLVSFNDQVLGFLLGD